MRSKIFTLVFIAATSGPCLAQTSTQRSASQAPKGAERAVAAVDYTQPANQPLYFQRPQVEIPAGESGWTIEVDTMGGLIPSRRSVTLTSKGRVTIDDSSGACSYDVEGGFPELDRLIAEANASGWGDDIPQPMPTEMCFDCPSRRLSLSGRGADGEPYGHAAYWDDISFAKLRKEVAAIYSAVDKIKRECPQTKGL